MNERFQLVSYWPEWLGFHFVRLDPKVTDMAYIFEWWVCLGFWNLRKWNRNPPKEAT